MGLRIPGSSTPDTQSTSQDVRNPAIETTTRAPAAEVPEQQVQAQIAPQNIPSGAIPAQPVNAMTEVEQSFDENLADTIRAVDDQKKTLIQSSLKSVSTESPDQAAKAATIAAKLRLPVGVVSRNLAMFEQEARASATDLDAIVKRFPATGAFLENPDQAAVVSDDIEALQRVEQAAKNASVMTRLGAYMKSAGAQLAGSAARLPGTILQAGLVQGSQMESMGMNPLFSSPSDQVLADIEGRTTKAAKVPEQWINNPAARKFDKIQENIAKEYPELSLDIVGSIKSGDYKSAGSGLLAQVIVNAPQSIALLGAAAAGFGLPALAGAGALSAADAMGEAVDEGVSPEAATSFALTSGLAEGAMEAIPVGLFKHWEGVISNSFGKQTSKRIFTDLFKTLFSTGVGEAGEEAMTSIAQDAAGYLTGVNKDLTFEQFLTNAANAGLVGGFSGGAITAPGAIASGASRGMIARQQAAQERQSLVSRETYLEMGKAATETRLVDRQPVMNEAFLSEVTKQNGLEKVFIPVAAFETYFQSKGIDPAQMAMALESGKTLDEAKETGAPLEIPYSKFLGTIGKTEHYAGLQNDVKFTNDALTVNESKLEQETVAKDIASEDAKAQTEPEQIRAVEKQIETQLKEANLDPKAAAAFRGIAVLAIRDGKDPAKALEELNLRIQRASDPASIEGGMGQTFNQGALNLPAEQMPTQSPIGFTSGVATEINKMDFKSIPGKDLFNRIQNTGGIKKDELESLGLKEYLEGVEGKVTKEDVLAFIQNNGVQVEQIVLGDVGDATKGFGSLSWGEQERDTSDLSDDINNEMEYYNSDQYEPWVEKKAELEAAYREENPDATDKEVEDAIEDDLTSWADEIATEYVESDEYSGARYSVTEDTTGWTLHGSDEYGWYNPETREYFETSLEEAKIQLAALMVEKGKIEGDLTELIKEQDVTWKRDNFKTPSSKTIDQKAKALLKSDPERFAAKASEYYKEEREDPESYFNKLSPEGKKERLDRQALFEAEREVEATYEDLSNSRNSVVTAIDHAILTGSIEGNNKKGYKLKFDHPRDGETSQRDLTAKTLDEAKAEAIALLKEEGIISGSAQTPEQLNQPTGQSKFGNWKVPGGTNYREVLLTLPKVDGTFVYRTHFSQRNVVAHLRTTDRVDAKGRKTLFVEELQSDWHQQGRERGYKESRKRTFTQVNDEMFDLLGDNTFSSAPKEIQDKYLELEKERDALEQAENDEENAVPDAPFKNTEAWAALAMKRIFRMAAEEGYDAVAWTPAAVHVDRWGTDSISWVKAPEEYRVKFKDAKIQAANENMREGTRLSDKVFKSKEELDAFMNEGSRRETLEIETIPEGYLVGSVEQVGGRDEGGEDIAELARRRGMLLEKKGERITTKDELRQVIGDTLNRERNDRSLNSLTDNVWEKMQKLESGVKAPRKEGMEFFYDNVLPRKVVPDILKKLDKGAKIEVGSIEASDKDTSQFQIVKRDDNKFEIFDYQNDAIISGAFDTREEAVEYRKGLPGFDPDQGSMKVLEVPLTDTMKSKLMEGQTLFQREGDGIKGQIRIGDQAINIDVFEGADMSTLLHEAGHLYLEMMKRMAVSENATDQVKADAQTIADYLGTATIGETTREQHEVFARSFEAYLAEGNAPTAGLKKAFARFKAWLINVYKDLTRLNVQLTPEIRGVFDRIIAADSEINKAEIESGYVPLFSASRAAGLSESQAKRLVTAQDEAAAEARERLTKKLLEAEKKKLTAQYREQARIFTEANTNYLNNTQVYKAISILQNGRYPDGTELPAGTSTVKLDRSSIDSKKAAVIENKFGKKVFSKEEGLSPDIIAPVLGFNDGSDLVDTLVAVLPIEQEAAVRTADQMAAQFPDLMENPTELSKEALEDVHNNSQSKLYKAELDILAENHKASLKDAIRAVAKRSPSTEEVRTQAEAFIGEKAVKDLKPNFYVRAEQKANKEAGELLANGDIAGAFEAKRRALLNYEMFKAATKAKEQVDKALQKFKPIYKKDADLAKRRDMDLVNAARSILGGYGLGRRTENPPREYLEKIKQYGGEDQYNGLMNLVNPALIGAGKWDEVSYNKFSEMNDAVGAIWELSKDVREITVDGKKMEIEKAVEELTAQIDSGKKYYETPAFTKDKSDWEKTKMKLLGARAALVRVEHWFRAVDGGKSGSFTKIMFNPVSEGTTTYRQRKNVVLKEFRTLMESIKDRVTFEPIEAVEIGHTFKDKTTLMMAMLHTGNSSNKSKLLRGRNWGEVSEDGTLNSSRWDAFVERMIREEVITKEDYDFFQKVWDLMESIKPEAQAAHRKIYGYHFAEITSDKIQTPFGEYKGGYVPAKVDIYESPDAEIRAEREAFDAVNNSSQFPTAGRGFSKSRVDAYAAPLSLDLTLLGSHIDGVLRFSHIEAPVKDVAKLNINKGLRAKIGEIDPSIVKNAITPWLQRAATQKVVEPSKSGDMVWFDNFAAFARRSAAMQTMFGNVVNTIEQFTGVFVAASQVKPKHLRDAVAAYTTNRKEMVKLMTERSKFMDNLQNTTIFESQEAIGRIVTNPSWVDNVQDFATRHTYVLQSATQNIVNTIVWNAAYNEALEAGKTEIDAVRESDSAVRRTQGSNNPEDVSAFETGTAAKRLFTQFVGYFNMIANLNGSVIMELSRGVGMRKGAGKLFGVYLMTMAIPAALSGVLRKLAGGDFDEDDDDLYVDDLMAAVFGTQLTYATAMVPWVGQFINASYNRFNDKVYDDRMSLSPVVSLLESTAGAGKAAYDVITGEDVSKRDVKDILMAIGFWSATPVGTLGRPVGYLMDVAEGEAEPTGAADFLRGLVTGRKGGSN